MGVTSRGRPIRVSNPVPGGHPATKTSFWCQVKYETCRRTELSARISHSWSPGLPLSIRSVPNQTPQSHTAPTTAGTQIKRGRPRVVCSRWIYYAVPPGRLAVPSTNSNRSDRAVLERPGESLGDLLPLRGNRIAIGEHEDHLDRPQGSLDPFLLNGFQSQRFEVVRSEPRPPVKHVEPLLGDCRGTPPRPQ